MSRDLVSQRSTEIRPLRPIASVAFVLTRNGRRPSAHLALSEHTTRRSDARSTIMHHELQGKAFVARVRFEPSRKWHCATARLLRWRAGRTGKQHNLMASCRSRALGLGAGRCLSKGVARRSCTARKLQLPALPQTECVANSIATGTCSYRSGGRLEGLPAQKLWAAIVIRRRNYT
jgi:hypothetical protein